MRPRNMTEIVHLAGPVCTFGSVSRQRCQWCGALIDEKDITLIAIQEDGRDPEKRGQSLTVDELGWWEGLVAVEGSNPRVCYKVDPIISEGELMPDGSPVYKAPERSCMRLFEGLESQT